MNKAVQRFCSTFTRFNGIDGKSGPCKQISSYKKIRGIGLIRQFVSYWIVSMVELDVLIFQNVFPFDGLSNGKDDIIGIQ